jgi:hypothetical protein
MLREGGNSQSQEIKTYVNDDLKASFTAMGLITFSGDALQLCMLARGKTERCEGQVIEKDGNKVSHSGNGWATLQVMREYFKFLHKTVEKNKIPKKQRIFLVLDVYSSHRNGEMIHLTDAQKIDLLFIPLGMTGDLQPSDVAVFGRLKNIGSCRWIQEYLHDPSQEFFKAKTSLLLQECWSDLNKENIEGAWRKVFARSNKILKEELLVPIRFSNEILSEKEIDSDSDCIEIAPKKTKRSKQKDFSQVFKFFK